MATTTTTTPASRPAPPATGGGVGAARAAGPRPALLPVGLVLGGSASLQSGAAIAALMFAHVGPPSVVFLRCAFAAAAMLAVLRPRVRGHTRADWATIAAFGVALGSMNVLIYEAIDRIPLGTAITIELLGPLSLSVLGGRGATRWLWAAMALGGVALLGRDGFGDLDPVGVGFALAAGAMWASYIVLSARTGRRFPRIDGLALALVVAAALMLPLALLSDGTAMVAPGVLAAGAGVALLSAVVPYSLELVVLRRLAAPTFAVLSSLHPVMAALAGLVILGQGIGVVGGLAVAVVVAASAGAVRSATRPSPAGDGPGGTAQAPT